MCTLCSIYYYYLSSHYIIIIYVDIWYRCPKLLRGRALIKSIKSTRAKKNNFPPTKNSNDRIVFYYFFVYK